MKSILCKVKGLKSMRLTKVEDIDSHIMWMSPELNHGDWPFRYFIRIRYTSHWDPEWAELGEYYAEIMAVSIVAAEKVLPSVAEEWGMSLEEFNKGSDEAKYIALVDRGTSARLFARQGTNMRKLLREAKHELPAIDFMFGAHMDKQQNQVGARGWDFIAGRYHRED
jgi:hypothetical protein